VLLQQLLTSLASFRFVLRSCAVKRADLEKETDMRRLQQRQKQINIAKQSEAYKKYIQLVPK